MKSWIINNRFTRPERRALAFILAGIDGTKEGWAVAMGTVTDAKVTNIRMEFINRLTPSLLNEFTLIAIDIPIGLPEQTKRGGRKAEQEARKILSGRSSSVFSTPCRSCLNAKTYQEALAISRASGPEGIGLSIQSYHILPKIKETDVLLQNNIHLQNKFFECHPELAFMEMKNENKPLTSKHHKIGQQERHDILMKVGFKPEIWHNKTPIVDQLDALACLWSAFRLYGGRSRQVPAIPPKDSTGLTMAIHW